MTDSDLPARSPHRRRRTVLRSRGFRLLPAIVTALLSAAPGASAQEPPAQAGGDALRVYLDCTGGRRGGGACDSDLYRQEITFVNWVRQPQDAQVHVILTSQDAGGGGSRYTLDFLGREALEGMEDQYTYSSSPTDVQDETVQGLLRVLRLGLVRYAAAAGFGADLEVSRVATEARAAREAEADQVRPEDDPWNFWVFNVDANASYQAEDLQTTKEFGFGVSANRTTEEWKLDLGANGNFQRERFELPQDDGTVEVEENNQDRWNVSGAAVKSLGGHLGVGAQLTANNSTRLNRELLLGLGTGVEYNYFPYAESNRRVLIGRYVVSVESVQYQDTTVFDLLEETVYRHQVNFDYEAREPWGNANVGAGVSQYLDRPDAWSLRVRGFVRYRLFRGFSVFMNGQYGKVEDQISLPKEELSDEDILLGRRQLPTESTVEFRIGLGYSFGSIFNNAVNERFSQGIF